MKKVLIDTFSGGPLTLTENKASPGKYRLEGKFGHVGRPTDNKRNYPRPMMERQIEQLQVFAKEGALFGELDHPEEATTALKRSAILIRSLKIMPNGDVIGEADVMDTAAGKDLKAIMDAGGKPGTSSRGRGSVKMGSDGIEEVQDDYEMDTYDVVARPAVSDARPRAMMESLNMEIKTVDELRQAFPELLAQLEGAAREDAKTKAIVESEGKFKVMLQETAEKIATEAKETVRAEMLEDPEVAKAKTVVEAIKSAMVPFGLGDAADVVKDLNEQIKQLKEDLDKERAERIKLEGLAGEATDLAHSASMLVHLARTTYDLEAGEELWEALQEEVKKAESTDAVDKMVEAAAKEMLEEQKAEEAKKAEVRKLEEQNAELTRALGRAVDFAKELEERVKSSEQTRLMESRRERVLEGHPRREQAERLIQAAEALDHRGVEEALKDDARRGSRLYRDVTESQRRMRSRRVEEEIESRQVAESKERRKKLNEARNPDGDDLTDEIGIPGVRIDDMLKQL